MNTIAYSLLLLLSVAAGHSHEPIKEEGAKALNCDLTVDAGPNQTICNPGQPTSLNAQATGPVLSVQWSPATGLSNPGSLNPVATVNNTTTYTVTVNGASSDNLMSNWDFSQGFAGFSSNYIPGNGGPFGLLSNEGTYAVSTNPALTHTNFASFGDFSGDGNMLVVNGAGVANQTVLCQTVSVTPNTNYAFSTYVASAIATSPARLQFSVNGQLIGNIFNASPTPGQWNQFYATWNSGPSNMATICVVNQNTAASGNDFCLDGLFFSELCQAIDDVTITVVRLNANFNLPNGLCEGSPPINLNNYLSPGATAGGSWTVNGIPTNIFDPGQWGAGVHDISYTVSSPPCTEAVALPIVVDPLPQAQWAPPFGICQANPPLDMNNWLAPGSLPGGIWTINGLPSNGQFNPAIWGPGLHLVSYTAGTLPCTNSHQEFVEVSELPSAGFTVPPEICEQAVPVPLSSWLDPGAGAGGTWTVNGIPATVLDPAALGPGVYDIIYRVGIPPCQGIDQGTLIITAGEAPMPSCAEVSNNSITVEWPPVPGAAGYSVQVLSGQSGGTLAGTSFTIGGLSPGETVSLVVLADSGPPCPPTPSGTISCTTLECTPPVVAIEERGPVCEDVPPFLLIAIVEDFVPPGIWSGPGIVDSTGGIFDPAAAGPGSHTVRFSTDFTGCLGQGSTTIVVLPVPVAAFEMPDSICQQDTALIRFTGLAQPGATFLWDFGGGSSANLPGDSLQLVSWPAAGQKIVSLQIGQEGCVSGLPADTIEVQPLLQPPLINCRSTETSVEFYWPPDPEVDSFLVAVLGPQAGMMPSDTSFLVQGLTPGETVNINITALSANACPDTLVQAGCIAEACPDITLSIASVPDICLDANTDVVMLEAILSGGPADGTFSWQGPGIADGQAGVFDPALAGPGTHAISLTYQHGSCSFNAGTTIAVRPAPVAAFDVASPICLPDMAQVSFTGSAGSNATFNWDLDGGLPGPGSPINVQWAEPGLYTIQLRIVEEGCISGLASREVQVDDTLSTPEISCAATYTSVLFSWSRSPLAFAYLANVIDGPPGTILSDTSLLISGLQPGQEASIELTALSSNACPSVTTSASCSALPCPAVNLAIEAPLDQCFGGTPYDIGLQIDIQNDTGNGTLVWSGAGITDPANGQWTVNAPQVGQPNVIAATWAEDVCVFADTAFLNVFATPTAAFAATPVICVEDEATLAYTGTATANAAYNWDFGGAEVVSGAGAGPFQLRWAGAGSYDISLQVEENDCVSEPANQTVLVEDTLAAPTIACEATYTSVLFTWSTTLNASAYQVEALEGPQGIMPTGTSYLISGLQPGQAVRIRLTAISDNACPSASTELACSALPCPAVSLAIEPPPDQCFDGTPYGIGLNIDIQNDTGNGTLSWSGAGITDPANGQWTVNAAQVGQPNMIAATWAEDVCVFADTAFLNVFATPTATFAAAPVVCVEEAAAITYSGTATSGAVYNWNFDGAEVVSGSGAGPYQLQWGEAGSYDISLQVEENACVSELLSHTIQVDPSLQAPEVACTPGFGTVLFSWGPVLNASGFQVAGAGSLLSDTAYLVDGLLPGQEAAITLTALSGNACPEVSTTAACAALSCPEASASLAVTPFLCSGDSAQLDITFSGNGGPYDMTLLINGQPMPLSGIETHYSMTLAITGSTLFSLENIVDAGHPNCGLPAPPPAAAVVRQPVDAGSPLAGAELCSRTDTSIQLFSLLEGEQPGGSWRQSSGPALLPGSFNPAAAAFFPAQQPAGNYLFTYAIEAQAPCPNDSATVAITINERPVADAGEDFTLSCTFNIGSLGGPNTSQGPGLQYQWTSGDDVSIMNPNLPVIDVSQPGTYQLNVLNVQNGCSDTDLAIAGSEISFLVPHASVSPISCFQANDGSIAIDSVTGGRPPYRYSLNGAPFAGSPAFVRLGPGVYDIAVEDAAGCRAELQFQLEERDEMLVVLVANFQSEDNSIQIGDSIRLQALVNIPEEEVHQVYWQPDSLGCDTCLTATFAPQLSTIFSVSVVDINGCSAEALEQVIVRKDYNVFIPNAFSPNGDGYNDVFMIFAGKEVKEVKAFMVFTRWGEPVIQLYGFQPNDPAYGWDGIFRGQQMNPAVFAYFAEIEMVDGQVVVFKGDVALVR